MIAWDVGCGGGEHVENSGLPLTVYTLMFCCFPELSLPSGSLPDPR